LLGLIVAGTDRLPALLAGLRLLLGITFVLCVPGYVLQAVLFPRMDDLDGPERLALSFGLSVAGIAPIALVLDRLPWGIRLWPVVVAEGTVVVGCSIIAWIRRWLLPREERFALEVHIDLPRWWADQDRANRILYGISAGAVLVALVAATVIFAAPKPGERFTEFYILGPEGLAENYPREAAVGQPVEIAVGIANREGVTAAYRVEVENEGHLIGQSDWVQLAPDAVDERTVTFVPREAGEDVLIAFLLYRDGGTEPYRTLRLWLKVKE
jgi:uncharacterized membrane protein